MALLLPVCTHVPAPSLKPACLTDGDEDVDRYDHQGCESYVDICGEHEDEGQDGAGEQRQKIDEEILHCRRKAADSLIDTCLQLSGLIVLGREESHPVGQHAVYDGLREVLGHIDSHLLAEEILGKCDAG